MQGTVTSDVKLNNYLQPTGGPYTGRPNQVISYNFEDQYQVQARKVVSSRVELQNFVRANFGTGDTAYGTLSGGSVAQLSSTFEWLGNKKNSPMFAIPYISLYQGTVWTNEHQIWPFRGGSVTAGRYSVTGWFDWNSWWGIGLEASWKGILIDTTGTSNTVITIQAGWQFLDYTSGSAI